MSGDDDDDLGEPIDLSALLDDGDEPQTIERARLNGRIERRQVGADLTAFFWTLPMEVMRGFLGMFDAPRAPRAEDDDG